MTDDSNFEIIFGGLSAIHTELQTMNKWLHKLYDIEMTTLAEGAPATFHTIDTVHNRLKMFMDQDWESRLQGDEKE